MAKTASKTKASAKSTKATRKTPTKATKAKAKPTKKKAAAKKSDVDVKILDETGNRKKTDRRAQIGPVPTERRKAPRRRRQIDPTTCEREYTDQEIQFMEAMDEYKQLSGRMFPTCSEILEVLDKLGYRQVADIRPIYDPEADAAAAKAAELAAEEDADNEVESCV